MTDVVGLISQIKTRETSQLMQHSKPLAKRIKFLVTMTCVGRMTSLAKTQLGPVKASRTQQSFSGQFLEEMHLLT
jgi:hypothetical protein